MSETEEDVSKDSGRNEERAECNAEDRREDFAELVTQQSVEISEQETVEIENEESEKKHGEGKAGLLWKKDYIPLQNYIKCLWHEK